MYQRHITGKVGEEFVEHYLENNKYEILDKNFKCKSGEIDFIIKDKEEIAFVEVKTRTSTEYGEPSEAVTKQKMKHIKSVAKYYIHINDLYDNYFRFDVIELKFFTNTYLLNHIKMAFE